MMTDDESFRGEQPRPDERSTSFPERLAKAIGGMSIRAFARAAGVSDTFLRQCLAGRTEPTRTKLLAIAHTGHVGVEWLVSGNGPMRPEPVRPLRERAAATDRHLLETIIELTESVLAESGRPLAPARKARLITAVYHMHAGRERATVSRESIQDLVICAT